MMAGVPGSGKSYIADQLGQLLSYPIFSADAFRAEISGDVNNQSVSRQAWELVYSHTEAALDAGQSVIIDGVHRSREQRRRDIRRYRSYGARSVNAVYIMTNLETALARNAARDRSVPIEVIQGMHNSLLLSPPSVADGFDTVICLDNS